MIVVCDMYRDDATVAIAKSFGARVCFHERLGFADPARSFAIAQARHDWILVLDADELITVPLAKVLAEVVADGTTEICWIPRLNCLLGEPINGLGWGGAIIHFNYIDIEQFISKLNRYTSIEAVQADQLGKPAWLPFALIIALRETIRRYCFGGGYRFGWRGVYLTILMVGYRLAVRAKLRELRAGKSRSAVQAHYAREAEIYLRAWNADRRDRES